MGLRENADGKRGFDGFRLSLFLIPCILFIYELLGASRFAGWDVTRLNLPLKWYDVNSVREGIIPLWNHYLYAGMPQLAESESGLFYPGNILLYLPGDFFYWANLTIILHFVLAGLFADLWLRGRGIRREIAFFGAILFQTAPFLLFHVTSMALLQSIVWFPLILWLADRVIDCPDSRGVRLFTGLLMLMGGLLMVVGNGQMAFYQGFLLSFYLLGHVISSRDHILKKFNRALIALIAILLGAGLIGAVIWIPAREFAATTVREAAGGAFYQLGTWLTPRRLASAFFYPVVARETVGWASSLIYVGLLPVMLSFVRLAGIRVNWRKDAPLILMGGVALFLAFGWNNPVNHFLVRFEPFSMFRYQGRMAIGVVVALIAFSMQLLSDYCEKKTDIGRILPWCAGIAFISLFAFIFEPGRTSSLKWGLVVLAVDTLLCAWAFTSLLKNGNKSRFPAWMTVYIVFHLLIVFPVGRLATINTEVLKEALTFFDRLHRSDGLPPRLLVADVGKFADRDLTQFNLLGPQETLPNLCAGNTSVFAGVQTMDPYTPLRPRVWHELIREKILPAFENSSNGELDESGSINCIALGIDAIVTSRYIHTIPGYHLEDDTLEPAFGADARLYMIDIERPRMYDQTGAPFTIGHSRLGLDRNRTIAQITTSSACKCIIEVSYSPNWRVKINGEPDGPVEQYNEFCSVNLPGRGEYTIEMQYVDDSFNRGLKISAVGLFVLLVWLLSGLDVKGRHRGLPLQITM